MLDDEQASSVANIAERMNRSRSYATQYKNRLLGQGVIAQDASEKLRFELPYMREFVAQQQ